ncbi:alpha/beta hydrolase [Xanthobacter sp. AM11]|uniref:alpha/beta hydrolase n=1 Tax=Xanthobacter sp. AM11 TaxID=3380643 RepID=UPI0039BF895E
MTQGLPPAITPGPKIAALSCGKPVFLVVLLHGEGSDGQAVIDLALNWAPTMPKADFLAAQAPFPCAGGGRRWFESGGMTPQAVEAGLRAAAPQLDAFLDEMLAQRRLDDSHLALVGFSQGAMLALHVGLRRPRTPASIVAFSGALFDLDGLEQEISARPQVLMIHGEADEVVPFAAMTATRERLKALGVPAKGMRRPGLGHASDDDGVIAAGDFLSATVVRKPAAGPADHDHDDHDGHDGHDAPAAGGHP